MNTVYDIPTGIFTCLVGENEYSITKLSKRQVEIRSLEEVDFSELSFCAFFWEKNGYEKSGPFKVRLIDRKKDEFMVLNLYEILEDEFEKLFDRVVRQYQKYIMLKLESEDNYFSGELVNYPYKEDEIFSKSYLEWINKRKDAIEKLMSNVDKSNASLAIALETPWEIRSFIEKGGRTGFNKKVERIYIGNAFCHNLFPDKKLLEEVLFFAKEKNYGITIVTTYLREGLVESEKRKYEYLSRWSKENGVSLEIEINDFGYLELLKNINSFTFTLGRLLNKRRKDPRYKYKVAWEKLSDERKYNSINDEDYAGFLEKIGVLRYEMESCGYEIETIPKKTSLHLPLYQTNTSQYCPLAALYINHDRGKQSFMEGCPKYCENNYVFYPEHLNMIGKYNSLLALETKNINLTDRIDRVVWNLAGFERGTNEDSSRNGFC